jgi:hypothetical protein
VAGVAHPVEDLDAGQAGGHADAAHRQVVLAGRGEQGGDADALGFAAALVVRD